MSTARTNVLVGVDFSEGSNRDLTCAVELFGQAGAQLHLAAMSNSSSSCSDAGSPSYHGSFNIERSE